MKKEVIKSFNLEAYKKGAKVQTRGGAEARIICTDAKDRHFPIVALIELVDGGEVVQSYTSDGRIYFNGESNAIDLVIVEEVEEFWSDKENKIANGYFIESDSRIAYCTYVKYNQNRYKNFANRKQAISAIAMAIISQIMANDIENFGGVVTDEEWENSDWKYVIFRSNNKICTTAISYDYYFLAFHTEEQRNLFLEKYPNLVKDYLMID
jgi:hypothetical protein